MNLASDEQDTACEIDKIATTKEDVTVQTDILEKIETKSVNFLFTFFLAINVHTAHDKIFISNSVKRRKKRPLSLLPTALHNFPPTFCTVF